MNVRELRTIALPAEPHAAEQSMAKALQDKLQALYEVELTAVTQAPREGQPAIFLGRTAAIASGLVNEAELEAVKHDGYVLRGATNRVAIAGFAPQGTIYGTYAFLRHVGLKLYPWRNFGAVEVRQPIAGGVIPDFTISSKPFFERRDLLGWLDGGRWGASLREYGLGEFRHVQDHEYFKGKGWLGGDHTAPYLVPMGKYYDSHPEYFALKGGKRIPEATQNARVAICMSNPEVHQIAADRALEWMGDQPDRRFFHVTDGDTSECRCPHCVASDPAPTSYTDRYLKWANSVARAVAREFPENVCLPLAYGNSTQPPVETKPEPNSVVMYCPWYWNSRTTSATTWAHPQNLTAMREFMAWAMRFPGQVGLYDYPGSWVQGQAGRLKFLAKNNARVFYSCGGSGDLFQWVNTQLLWDPFLNTEDLIDEFAEAYYGPAAAPMLKYLRLRQDAIETRMVHTREAFGDAAFLRQVKALMAQAEEMVGGADDATQARVWAAVLTARELLLQKTHPQTGAAAVRSVPQVYRAELDRYVALSKRLSGVYERLGGKYVIRQHLAAFENTMKKLGLVPAKAGTGGADAVGEEVFDRTIATLDDQLRKLAPAETAAARAPRTKKVSFGAPGEPTQWLADASQAALISPPELATLTAPSGETLTGIRLQAPLSRLPIIDLDRLKIHAGRFYIERVFDPPVDATDCPFLDLHVHVSADVPVTVYMNNAHSDLDLHAGEQIVRIDFRNFQDRGRFTFDEWDKQVHRVSFDLWPQDNYPPYPAVRDVELVVFGMAMTNEKPTPDRLPHRGKAVWLSQFRPNLPRGLAVPREQYDQYLQRQHYQHVGLDYGSRWFHERFRTFTEHRSVCPVFAIVTGADPSGVLRQAADALQSYLEKMLGVRLPLNPEAVEAARTTGNAIFLGRRACQAAGCVTEEELEHVGPQGFVINAWNGRLALAGPDDAGTAHGVARYLEDHGARFFAADRAYIPNLEPKLLHELYLLDWPYFKERPLHGGWQLRTQRPPTALAQPGTPEAAKALAVAIKDVARRGEKALPPALLGEADRSALTRYLAAKLLWDPFADATRLTREYLSLGRTQ